MVTGTIKRASIKRRITMKKLVILLSTCMLLLLGGCSFLNDAQDTLTYVNEATDYLAAATDFASDAPALAQQAIGDLQAAEDLQNMLQQMQQTAEAFNELQAPDIAAELHQQIIEQNSVIVSEIETFMSNFKDGLLNPAILENTELFQTVQDITSIIDQIQQLGGE
jgi:vacuolar-type H+-ATPase catalytic subunit A/Vma1